MPILSITVDKLKLPNPFFWHRGRERSRGQSGTIEIGPVERGNWMLQLHATASLANTPEAYARVSCQALKSESSWTSDYSRVAASGFLAMARRR